MTTLYFLNQGLGFGKRSFAADFLRDGSDSGSVRRRIDRDIQADFDQRAIPAFDLIGIAADIEAGGSGEHAGMRLAVVELACRLAVDDQVAAHWPEQRLPPRPVEAAAMPEIAVK